MSSYAEGLCMRGVVGTYEAIIQAIAQAITQDLCCIYDTRVCPYKIIVDKAFLGHIIKTDSKQLCKLLLRKPTMYSHLNALQLRLSHEKTMLSKATAASEKALRSVWVNQIEKEIQGEYKFLNIVPFECSLSDDELLKELNV